VINTKDQLNELYRVIKTLMNATLETKDKKLKPLLATLEYKPSSVRNVSREDWL